MSVLGLNHLDAKCFGELLVKANVNQLLMMQANVRYELEKRAKASGIPGYEDLSCEEGEAVWGRE